ncbi:MAG: hypothetical protein L0956_07260 [Candidatus Mariimomonas ferrooxydans]
MLRKKDLKEFMAIKNFQMMTTPHGPPEVIQKGMLVWLNRDTALDLLHTESIFPLGIPEESEYKVIGKFVYLKDGKNVPAEINEIMRLDRFEALPLMLSKKVKPINKNSFYPWR